jgi:hypothetical protein
MQQVTDSSVVITGVIKYEVTKVERINAELLHYLTNNLYDRVTRRGDEVTRRFWRENFNVRNE